MAEDEKKPFPKGAWIFFVVLALFIGGVLYISCFNYGKSRAHDNFASTYACPSDRIEMKMRDDIKGSMFVTHPKPAADVAKDPTRLAIWQKQEDERDEQANARGNYGKYYWHVRGCDHDELYECSNKPSCSTRKFPASVSSVW